MNHQSTVTVKQSASPKEVQQTFSAALSPVHDIFKEKSKGKHLLVTDHPSLYLQTESISSPSFQLVSPLQRQKSGSSSVSDSSMSYISHLQYPKNMFSRSSTFCTSLYSSSTSTEAHQQFGNLPFLPHPPKCKQTVPANPSPKSSLLLSGDLNNQFSEESGYLMKDFLNSPEVELECSFHGGTHESNSLTLTEQMELQFLSEQLDIAITDNGANPGIDEIYEAPQVSSPPTAVTNDNHNYPPSLESPVDNQIHSCHPSSGNAASHKPRMRWTPELHECFLEAVKKLDGAEKATPKGILKLMNIEGLTIYHVKSHLQKYRLAKYMPETTKDKKSISSEENEKKADPNIINESDAHSKRGIQVAEALRMQMDVQRQLHEQLEVQRALQLRIEEHARYLHKILEEQEKASNTFASSSNNTSILNNIGLDTEHSALPTPVHSMPEQTDSKTDSSASLPSKHLGNECHEVEQLVGQKRTRHEVKPEPGALRMESPVHH